MDNNEFLFRTTNTLVIARKSKIFVAIQKIRVWLWITSSSATPRNDETDSCSG